MFFQDVDNHQSWVFSFLYEFYIPMISWEHSGVISCFLHYGFESRVIIYSLPPSLENHVYPTIYFIAGQKGFMAFPM